LGRGLSADAPEALPGLLQQNLHISDTHLSGLRPFFVANFFKVCEHVALAGPDLVLNTGDMSLDGANCEKDLAESRRLHDGLGLSVRYIPGNHDVGESQDAAAHAAPPVINCNRRKRYLDYFGPDYWRLDVPSWRIIAVNAQLLGSDLAAADEQLEFVREGAASVGGRSLALFTHKPLFHMSPDEDAVTGRFVNPTPRGELLKALGDCRPLLVGSGHVHQFLSSPPLGTHHVWAPSTGFVLPDARQPKYGLKQTGYVQHLLEPDGSHQSNLVTVPETLSIADFPEAYPKDEKARRWA
jgi:Icc protein